MVHTERTESRADERVAIELWVQQIRNGRVVLHPAANLSLGGLFLYAPGMRLGDTHLLEFSPPGAQRAVQVRARVAWLRGDAGAGMEFLDLSMDDREAIVDLARLQ